MLKLIRLEWKKNNVGKYIRNVVIVSALICLFIFALCYLGIANDPDSSAGLYFCSSPSSFRRMGCKRRRALCFGHWTEENSLCIGF